MYVLMYLWLVTELQILIVDMPAYPERLFGDQARRAKRHHQCTADLIFSLGFFNLMKGFPSLKGPW